MVEKIQEQAVLSTNLTDGGEGPSGYTHTQDTLDKMSEARSGKKSPNFGKFMTIEQKKKLSESHKGQLAWNKGITGRKWFHDPITNKSIICNPNDAPVNYVLGRSNN